jgi:hypothetical protein
MRCTIATLLDVAIAPIGHGDARGLMRGTVHSRTGIVVLVNLL